MTVYIDADGCPVVDIAIMIAKEAGLESVIVCDTSHVFERDGARTMTVSEGADSVDFALVNMIRKGDIAITQDYGLAAMCLAMGAITINQNGMEYTNENIDSLLMNRHVSRKIRMAGRRLKGPSKRTDEQDREFERKLRELLLEKG